MSSPQEFNDRVVYAALKRMSDSRTVIKSAFSYWRANLSQQEFDVIAVVSALVDYLDLSGQEKKTLMIGLHAASNRLFDDLAPVPGIIANDNNSASDATIENDQLESPKESGPASPPHCQVTQRYLQVFAQHLRKTDPGEFTDFRQAVASEGLPEAGKKLSKLIADWASNGMANLVLPSDVNEANCKSLAHELYLLAVDFIGPNVADDVVYKAINDCLDMDAAMRFNPRDLT